MTMNQSKNVGNGKVDHNVVSGRRDVFFLLEPIGKGEPGEHAAPGREMQGSAGEIPHSTRSVISPKTTRREKSREATPTSLRTEKVLQANAVDETNL